MNPIEPTVEGSIPHKPDVPVNTYHRDKSKRKAKKETRNMRKDNGGKRTLWKDIHVLISDLQNILIDFSSVGRVIGLSIPAIQYTPRLYKLLETFSDDINRFDEKLNTFRVGLPPANQEVSAARMPDYLVQFEGLDALRVDVTTVLAPLQSDLEEEVEVISENHKVAPGQVNESEPA